MDRPQLLEGNWIFRGSGSGRGFADGESRGVAARAPQIRPKPIINPMAKSQNARKQTKKPAEKSPKQKKVAKRAKT
jgi:hypothetical protein